MRSVDVVRDARLKKLRTTRTETGLGGSEYQARLRGQFARVYGDASWAHVRTDAAEPLLQRAGPILGVASTLPPRTLALTALRHANQAAPSTVQDIFHGIAL